MPMRHHYHLFLLFALLINFPLRAQHTPSETILNGEYRSHILQHIKSDVAGRQKLMQKRANSYLLNLPLDDKLYDESKFNISARVTDDMREDGRPELNYVVTITYNSTNLEGTSDDYPRGDYILEHSNSGKALCHIAKMVVDDFSNDLFVQGRNVTVRIASSADGQDISHIQYGGEYGERRYDAARFNGERVRLSLSPSDGISTNAQLAFARALGVEDCISKSISGLSRTTNLYEYETFCAKEVGARYRRVSLEFIVHGAFDSRILEMNEKLINDQYVDYNVPILPSSTNKDMYVLIIANEHYDAPLPDCQYAENDGEMMRQYCIKTLGVPERHVRLLNNIGIDDLQSDGIRWLKDITVATRGAANILVYYSGHGFSDADYKPYLLFPDFDVSLIKTWRGKTELDPDAYLTKRETSTILQHALSLDTLCAWFNRVANTGITFIVDAGFNGTQRSGEPLFNVKRSNARLKGLRIRNDIVILAAADVNKTAYSFDEQRHGFLTYFILKELKRTKGNLSYGELYKQILQNLGYESSLQGKLQEPIIISGGKTKDNWEGNRFK